MEETKSQSKQILNHLSKGVSITPIDALQMFGCFRLGARIKDLRNEGYPIKTTTIKSGKKRFASYTLESNQMRVPD